MLKNRIVVIAPKHQLVIHSGIDIYDLASVKQAEAFIKNKELQYGELDRILLAGDTTRIMEPGEPIPVPLQPGRGLMIPGGGGRY